MTLMTLNKILEWCKNNIGKELESPMSIVFQKGRRPQNFVMININNKNEVIKIQFEESKILLPLDFGGEKYDKISVLTKEQKEIIEKLGFADALF